MDAANVLIQDDTRVGTVLLVMAKHGLMEWVPAKQNLRPIPHAAGLTLCCLLHFWTASMHTLAERIYLACDCLCADGRQLHDPALTFSIVLSSQSVGHGPLSLHPDHVSARTLALWRSWQRLVIRKSVGNHTKKKEEERKDDVTCGRKPVGF